MCYTYDELSRVTARTARRISDDFVLSAENFVYDAAGNIYGADTDNAFEYDVNNRLTSFNGNAVSYDADGNMLSNGVSNFTYDSANRLVSADGHTYVYNAEDVRIRAVHNGVPTTYTYDTNAKLSQLLVTETNGVTTKYVYGLGLIGEEVNNSFKTYHFDYRGSTVAITNVNGTVIDAFSYDTYGKIIGRTGNSDIIFLYNGRDGVITEPNGLLYMRARYYSPDMRRFINADIIPGEISNAVTLNRYAYANGNPVMFVDPFGLTAQEIFDENSHAIDNNDSGIHGGGQNPYRAYGIDPSVMPGGSYYNYLIRSNTMRYDADLGGYSYTGTSTTFANLSRVYINGTVSVYEVPRKTVKEIDHASNTNDKARNPDVTYPGDDPTVAPNGYKWTGKDPQGGKRGGYKNTDPNHRDSWHPDLDHPGGVRPHWDYNDGSGGKWRVFPDAIERVK